MEFRQFKIKGIERLIEFNSNKQISKLERRLGISKDVKMVINDYYSKLADNNYYFINPNGINEMIDNHKQKYIIIDIRAKEEFIITELVGLYIFFLMN